MYPYRTQAPVLIWLFTMAYLAGMVGINLNDVCEGRQAILGISV